MTIKNYHNWVKAQETPGFTSGFKFEEFELCETVYLFHWNRQVNSEHPIFVEATVTGLQKEDRTARVYVTVEGHEWTVNGHNNIKYHIFKKIAEEPVTEVEEEQVSWAELDEAQLEEIKEIEVENGTLKQCEDCGAEFEAHDFTYSEKCVTCSDIAMMNDMDEELGENEAEVETIVVERAMSVKNPAVKALLAEGWQWVSKEWNKEKNMYLATLVRA